MGMISDVPSIPVELVTKPQMLWYCWTCKKRFLGPTDRSPKGGCAHCGLETIFDLNIEPLGGPIDTSKGQFITLMKNAGGGVALMTFIAAYEIRLGGVFR